METSSLITKKNRETATVNDVFRKRLWTARIMGGIVVLFMLFDGIGKIAKPAQVVESTLALGFEESHLTVMGVLSLLSTFLYAVRRTRLLGALLLTSYLGGAVAAQLRVDSPLWSNTLFPVYVAVIAWGAIWLTDCEFRNIFWKRG